MSGAAVDVAGLRRLAQEREAFLASARSTWPFTPAEASRSAAAWRAVDPPTVLALLDENERLTEALAFANGCLRASSHNEVEFAGEVADLESAMQRRERTAHELGVALAGAEAERDAAVQALADAVRQAKLDVLDEAMVRYRKVHVGPSGGAYTMLREFRRAVSEGSAE
jgi:hypothetical protein